MAWHELVNTRYFSEAAIDFRRNGGKYTLAPPGSREHREYWELQEQRCANGYSVGGTWVTGRHYWFLNFTPIKKIPDADMFRLIKESRDKRGKISQKTMTKILEHPRFYEIGWEWYRYKHIAWNGGTFQGIISPGGEHMICAKTRGAGFSYMEASDGVYNYTLIPGSISYYFAGIQQYLDVDGILNKTKDMADWINANIPWWSQNRQEHDKVMHLKASYKDAFGQTKGNLSEIIGVAVDDPEKIRGKRGIKIVFEEFGSFKNAKKALSVCKGSIKDGSFEVGQISAFGTGGEEGPSIEALEEVFDDPRSYGFMAFNNIWDEGMAHTECGFFVPAQMTDIMYMNEEGEVDLEGALAAQEAERAIAKKAKDPRTLDRRKAEYPIYPKEVFSRLGKNPFNKQYVDQQINHIMKSSAVQDLLRYGHLTSSDEGENGWMFHIQKKEDAKPVDEYPHDQKNQAELEGCITVVERPHLDQTGHTPEGVYQMVFDPFYKDESDDLTSLFDCTVWKQYNQVSPLNENLPIAWYTGRPGDLTDAIRIMFNMAMWYNCKIQGEIAGGGQAVLDYAKTHKLMHMLDFELEMTDNREVTEKKNKSYLMNMPTDKKRMGLTYFINWHMEQRGIRDDKTPIFNVQRCYKLGLLREMSKFDGKKNADRISSSIVAMFSLKEKVNRAAEQQEGENSFFNRPLYSEHQTTEEEFVPQY